MIVAGTVISGRAVQRYEVMVLHRAPRAHGGSLLYAASERERTDGCTGLPTMGEFRNQARVTHLLRTPSGSR